MRVVFLSLVLVISGCGWYPVVMYNHVSNPAKGGCENSMDYFAGGIGYGDDTAKIYITAGQKMSSACVPGVNEYVVTEPGAQLLLIKEFRSSHGRF